MTKYKLGEICEIVSGSTPKTGIAEYWGGELKWITPAEISEDSYIITDSVRKLTESGIKKTGLTPLPKGTVILSSRAPIGKVAIAGCEMYCNQGFKNLICTKKINNRYLYWFLKGNTAYLNSLGRGATFKEISKQIVSGIEINVPDMNQQMQAVENLEKVWRIIQLRKQELQKGDELIKARFVEMFGDPVLNPLRWDVKPVIDICDCMVPGRDKPKSFTGAIPWITIDDLIVNSTTFRSKQELGLTEAEIGEVKRKTIPVGSVIMSCVGNLGICSIAGNEMIINQQLHSFQCHSEINNVFLMYYLGQRKDYMEKQASSTTVLYMNKSVCNSIPVIIPDLELQEQFSDFVKQVDKSKVAIQAALDKSQLLFDSLMQKYFG